MSNKGKEIVSVNQNVTIPGVTESSKKSNSSFRLTPFSSKKMSVEYKKVMKAFNTERILKESDPHHFESADEMNHPDLLMKGQKIKTFETKGDGLLIKLDELHEFSFLDFIKKRKFFRIAFLRVVWIPSATDLPGSVNIGVRDLRAKRGKETIDSKEFTASTMHNYTYFQDVYFSKKDLNKIAIHVNFDGYQEKYESNNRLGLTRIYWVIHNTNVPTQHVKVDSMINEMKLLGMPSLFRDDSSLRAQQKATKRRLSLDSRPIEIEDITEITSSNLIENNKEIKNNSDAKNTIKREFKISVDSSIDFSLEENKDKIEGMILNEINETKVLENLSKSGKNNDGESSVKNDNNTKENAEILKDNSGVDERSEIKDDLSKYYYLNEP